MTQRHEQPVADERPSENIPADSAPAADGEISVAGPRRTAASGAAFQAYLPWLT
jgi:hypothetical protein